MPIRPFARLGLSLLLLTAAAIQGSEVLAVVVASDDYESGSGVSYGAGGGTGLGVHTDLSGGGGIFHQTGSRRIDGVGSLGSFSGGTFESWGRSVTDTSAFGANPTALYSVAMRLDIPNSNPDLKGFNVKSALGTTFGANELLSAGMTNANNSMLLVTDSTGPHSLDLGEDIRGDIILVSVIWDTTTGNYQLNANLGGPSVSLTGVLQNPGSFLPGALGFAHGDVSGPGNDVMFDNVLLQALPVPEVSPIVALPFAVAVLATLSAVWSRCGRKRRECPVPISG